MATVAEIFETMEYGPAPESDAPARAWLDQHGHRFGHFIDGGWTRAGKALDVFDPSTGRRLATVTQGSARDVDVAVRAARKAFRKWSRLTSHQRARHLYALARMVQKHSRLFAVLESMDNGKPIRETRDLDIPLAAYGAPLA
jgi:aldehyde dehydrogenase (NAD+)